jgi:hypothetical protein
VTELEELKRRVDIVECRIPSDLNLLHKAVSTLQKDVSSIKVIQESQTRILDWHTNRLADIDTRLTEQGMLLREHSERLDGIDAKLNDHGELLRGHGELLHEILRRLPAAN